MNKTIGISLISLLVLLTGYVTADTKSTDQQNPSGFKPHFFTTLGLMSWENYNEGTLSRLFDDVLQNGVPASFTFDSARESTVVGGVGMRPTERWSFEFRLNALPQADYSVGPPFSDQTSTIVVDSNTHGWNAKIAAEYAIPLGSWGLKATARVGYSHSKIKLVEISRSTDPDSIVVPITARTSSTWRDPFLGVGLRMPFLSRRDNWEMSVMFTRIFTDEERVNQSLSAQMVYNFK